MQSHNFQFKQQHHHHIAIISIMSARRLLMCSPKFFDVVYAINPWMKKGAKVDRPLAVKQWEFLHATLQKAGA
jgi:hypothetical protein